MASAAHRPSWIRVERLLGEHGIPQESLPGRQRFEEMMERRRTQESDPESLKALRRGGCLGSESFRREMLVCLETQLGEHHAGQRHQDVALAKAEKSVAEEERRRGWGQAELLLRGKSEVDKLEIAARLRRETTLSIRAIAARVNLGTSKAVNKKLHNHLRGRPANDPAQVRFGL